MSTNPINPTIAFFGATGGCTNACLTHALRAGYTCVALVRTPSKLQSQLKEQGISPATLQSHLLIVTGNATDKSAVKSTLTSGGPNTLPSIIVSGLGGAPKLGGWSLSHPLRIATLDQPTICADAARAQIEALAEIYEEQPELKKRKPSLVCVSTTGVSRGPEDVPFGMQMLYHGVLEIPHDDKRNMEDVYRGEVEKGDGSVLRAVSCMRPTLLTGGVSVAEGKGLASVKAGTEDKPATGYTVGRADVGHWMFQNLIHDEDAKKKWEGQMVSLTY